MTFIHTTDNPAMKAWEYRGIPLHLRVKSKIIHLENGCEEFTGTKDTHGYGQVKAAGGTVRVHRWVWEQSHGKIPNGKQVLHSCDNPACANVEHLHLGSHADNMREKAERGRSHDVPKGAAHKRPMAKLNEDQVREIRALLSRGYRQADICRDYRVSRAIVSDIHLHKTWAWLD